MCKNIDAICDKGYKIMKNSRKSFCACKLKMYKVARNNEIHRKMCKENDFKKEKLYKKR